MKQKYIEEQKEEVEMSMHDKPALNQSFGGGETAKGSLIWRGDHGGG